MAIAFVNSVQASGDGASTTIALPAMAVTEGNLIVVGVRNAVSSIADTAGNTYTKAVERTGSDQPNEIWYAKDVTGHATNVITITHTSSVAYRRATAAQYSGCDVTSPLDTTATGISSMSATVTSGAFTTAQANELIVCHANVGALTSNWTVDTGHNEREQTTNAVTVLGDIIVAAIQSGVTVTYTSSDNIAAKSIVVATFKAAPTGHPARRRMGICEHVANQNPIGIQGVKVF